MPMADENKEDRHNRELIELLNELRVALPGVQVLFAFLLAVPFANGFPELVPPAPLAPARQGAAAHRLEPADDRGAGLPRRRDHEHRVRDHRLSLSPNVGGDVRRVHRGVLFTALVRAAARRGYSGPSETETLSMTTSSCGLSRVSRGSSAILSTTSMPSVTRPKTVCFPSSQGAASVVTMKNWLPFVFGPAFAMAKAPRSTLWSLNSSSNV